MENEEVIREKMEVTRTDLADKLDKLEQTVVTTVKGATGAVSDTVEAVKDTVQETKDAVTGTVDAVKESVKETVDTVTDTVKGGLDTLKELFDIPLQTQRHPWLVMGAAALGGFVLGNLTAGRKKTQAVATAAAGEPRRERETHQRAGHANGKKESARPSGLLGGLFDQLGPEFTQIRNVAIGMMMDAVRDMFTKAVPEAYQPHVAGIIDRVGAKLRGEEAEGEQRGDRAQTGKKHGAKPGGNSESRATQEGGKKTGLEGLGAERPSYY